MLSTDQSATSQQTATSIASINYGQAKILKKNTAIIHCSGKLSLFELKICNALLFNAYDDLMTKRVHSIPQHYLSQLIGFENSHNNQFLEQALTNILETKLEFNLLSAHEEDIDLGTRKRKKVKWEIGSMISWVVIQDGLVNYEYAHALAEKLSNPESYALINFFVHKEFQSAFSYRLYENCYRFKDANQGSTGFIEVALLRKILGATDSTYDQFKYFRSKVLEPAVKEINTCHTSDIEINMEFEKMGREVKRVRFTVRVKQQISIFDPVQMNNHFDARKSPHYARMRDHGISDRLAVMWILQDEHRIGQIVDYVEDMIRKGKVKSSPSGLIKTFAENHEIQIGKSKAVLRIEAEQAKAIEEQLQKEKRAEERLQKAHDATEDVRKRIKSLSDSEFSGLCQEYISDSGAKSFNDDKKIFTDPLEKVSFNGWLLKKMRNVAELAN